MKTIFYHFYQIFLSGLNTEINWKTHSHDIKWSLTIWSDIFSQLWYALSWADVTEVMKESFLREKQGKLSALKDVYREWDVSPKLKWAQE
jgi:hypothetical protein